MKSHSHFGYLWSIFIITAMFCEYMHVYFKCIVTFLLNNFFLIFKIHIKTSYTKAFNILQKKKLQLPSRIFSTNSISQHHAFASFE